MGLLANALGAALSQWAPLVGVAALTVLVVGALAMWQITKQRARLQESARWLFARQFGVSIVSRDRLEWEKSHAGAFPVTAEGREHLEALGFKFPEHTSKDNA